MPANPTAIFDAFRKASERGLLPTSLDTAGLRELGAEVLAQAVFTAHGCNAVFVDKIKEVVDAIAAGDMDEATARVTLLETLKALGYTPEGGFPGYEGQVPEAIKGTLQDLTSMRRLKLIAETQRALAVGAGQQFRGSQAARLEQMPAWELIREISVRAPRNWGGNFIGEVPRGRDPRPRWIIAGGTMTADGRMIALKGDPIWGELGSYGNFQDALGVDHPPFAFNSGMGWQEIDKGECTRLGIRGPNGETPAEFHGQTGKDRPRTYAGPLPQISTRKMHPDIRKGFEKKANAVTIEGTTVPRNRADEIRARMAERLHKSITDRQAEYEGRGE